MYIGAYRTEEEAGNFRMHMRSPNQLSDIVGRLKMCVGKVLRDALSGVVTAYRSEDGYIRWGKVEEDICKAIETELRK